MGKATVAHPESILLKGKAAKTVNTLEDLKGEKKKNGRIIEVAQIPYPGKFQWLIGDYSALEYYEGVVVKANGEPLENGAWVRVGKYEITPELFGAGGAAVTDTQAISKWLSYIAYLTANGPVHAVARGKYTADQLEQVSQYEAGPTIPLQKDSIFLDLRGARFTHSGVGEGILTAEGNLATRYKFELVGGQFVPHQNTKWLTRSRDLRSSSFRAEIYGSTTGGNCIGHLAQNWRSWSENMSYGSKGDNAEFRKITHAYGFFGRAEAWAIEAYWLRPDLFTAATNYLGEFETEAAAVSAKGSPAAEGDYFYRRQAGWGAGYRVYRSTGWVDAMYARGEVFGWFENSPGTSDPGSATLGNLYYNTVAGEVRVGNGATFETVLTIADVDVSVAGRSFARNKVYDGLLAAPFDSSADGQYMLVQNAALYESEISGLRGVSDNNNNSLIYWNVAFAKDTIIENIGLEKANKPGDPVGYGVRVGPRLKDAASPPRLTNIRYSTTRGYPVDPKAGVVWEGQDYENFVETVAGVPAVVVSAGMMWPNTTYEVVVKSNSNSVVAKALVARKNGSAVLRINDLMATNQNITFKNEGIAAGTAIAEMDGARLVVPRGGSVIGITAMTDAPVTAGLVKCSARRGTGDLGTGGGSIGVEAEISSADGFYSSFTQEPEVDTFEGGDNLYCVYETDASLAGPSAIQATLELRVNGQNEWSDDGLGNLMINTKNDETLRMMMKVYKP